MSTVSFLHTLSSNCEYTSIYCILGINICVFCTQRSRSPRESLVPRTKRTNRHACLCISKAKAPRHVVIICTCKVSALNTPCSRQVFLKRKLLERCYRRVWSDVSELKQARLQIRYRRSWFCLAGFAQGMHSVLEHRIEKQYSSRKTHWPDFLFYFSG
jgi:hypothetical protein